MAIVIAPPDRPRPGLRLLRGAPPAAPAGPVSRVGRPAGCGRRGVVPVGQQRADAGDQGDGMVEHHVVGGGRNLDQRGEAAEPVIHHLAHLRRHDAVLGAEQRDPAVEPGQQRRGQLVPGEDARVEFPPHPPLTLRIDVSATWAATYGSVGWSGIGWNLAIAASAVG